MGTNDIRRGAPADAVEKGLASISSGQARAIRVSAVTIIPRHNGQANGTKRADAEKRASGTTSTMDPVKAPVDDCDRFRQSNQG